MSSGFLHYFVCLVSLLADGNLFAIVGDCSHLCSGQENSSGFCDSLVLGSSSVSFGLVIHLLSSSEIEMQWVMVSNVHLQQFYHRGNNVCIIEMKPSMKSEMT